MSPLAAVLRAWRGLREHTYLAFVCSGVLAAGVLLMGLYLLVVFNLRTAVDGWEKDVHVSAYFAANTPAEARVAAQTSVAARPDVAAVRYVSEAEAAAWMAETMPDLAPVLAELGPEALPASLEITLRRGNTDAAELSAFAADLMGSTLYDDVDYGQEWVARVHTLIEVLGVVGLALGVVVGTAALFLVGNTIHLVVYARRDEIEIMRLVGATDNYVLVPFLVEGALHGAVGAVTGITLLAGAHGAFASRVGTLMPIAFGSGEVPFLSTGWLVALVLGAIAVGTGAAWGAVARFLAKVP